MGEQKIGQLLAGLWSELQEPEILWQAGALVVCVLLAWWLARLLRWRAPDASTEALKRGAAALRRTLFPLLAVLLIAAGRAVLGLWHGTSLLSFVLPLFGALAGIRFAVYLLRLAFSGSRWLDTFERSIAGAAWAFVALHLTGLLPQIVVWMSGLELAAGSTRLSLWELLSAVFWVGVTLLLALWAGAALEARLLHAEGLHSSVRVVFARLGKAVLLVIAVLVVLPLLGVDLTVLSVFSGALGVGLGFGLQKIASNYLSGFIILLDRSVRLGDTITVDGQHGQVTRITTRYVVVRSPLGIEAIVPNDTLVTTTVLNHSAVKRARVTVRVQVSYRSKVEEVLQLMVQVAERHPDVLRDPAPAAVVVALADSGIELELGFWIEQPGRAAVVRSEVSVFLLQELGARGIEIPYPQREVRLLQGTSAP